VNGRRIGSVCVARVETSMFDKIFFGEAKRDAEHAADTHLSPRMRRLARRLAHRYESRTGEPRIRMRYGVMSQ
jgi:hypothetical protein